MNNSGTNLRLGTASPSRKPHSHNNGGRGCAEPDSAGEHNSQTGPADNAACTRPEKLSLSGQIRAAAAVAETTIIASIRTKMLPVMSIAIIIALLLLHGTLRGDGSLTGHLSVLLRYSLSAAIGLMGIALIWSSCASISQDIEEKHIQLVRVKPVSAAALWLGKWAGLMAGQLVLVTLAALTSAILIVITYNDPRHDDTAREQAMNQLLTGRLRISPQQTVTDNVIRKFIESHPEISQAVITPEIIVNVQRYLERMHNSVRPGESREWVFVIPPVNMQSGPVTMQMRGLTSVMRRATIDAKWQILSQNGELRAELPLQHMWSGARLLEFPEDSIQPAEKVVLRFINGAASNDTIVFDPHGGIDIRIPTVPFSLNFTSAMIVVLCKLAVLAALGVTLGACFSFPVASFNNAAIIFIMMLAGFFAFSTAPHVEHFNHHHHHHHDDDHDHVHALELINMASERILEMVGLAIGPVTRFRPVGKLADGIQITGADIIKALLIMPGGYGLLLWICGAWIFSKRELALPER